MTTRTILLLTALCIVAAMLTSCDFTRMPPCSSLIVIGTVTFSCPNPETYRNAR